MASAAPQTEILQQAEKLGLFGQTKVQIREMTGDIDANQLLAAGDIEANFFQHKPYLAAWQQQHGTDDFQMVVGVHVEPLGLYSKKVKKLAELPEGARIALAADPTNQARGLALLQANGLIKLKESDPAKIDYATLSTKDIASNPKKFTFVPIDRPQLPNSLDDAQIALSVVNGANALEAGIKPAEDAIVLEKMDGNPFINGLVTTQENADDVRVQAVAKALKDPRLTAWIKQTYAGSVVPVA